MHKVLMGLARPVRLFGASRISMALGLFWVLELWDLGPKPEALHYTFLGLRQRHRVAQDNSEPNTHEHRNAESAEVLQRACAPA